ncbi:MAG: TIGR02281 family clan AA aspartic protease [Arenimonas sp.]|nr:TIGR02281 family clan AA aspartic protease [Arenimonas sp.]MBP7917015.1 TIGR02281 family clan AA aspartic protease [Arenimonas sp.]
MTQGNINKLPEEVSSRLLQLLEATGKPIKLSIGDTVHKAEFADGQRLIVNFNPHTGKIWLAGKSLAAEYALSGGRWLSQLDGSELFERLSGLIDELATGSGAQLSGQVRLVDKILEAPPRQAREATGNTAKYSLLYLLILVPAGFFGFRYFSIPERPAEQVRQSAPADPEPKRPERTAEQERCETTMPANGAFESFSGQPGNPSSRTDVGISNGHSHDTAVFFTAPGSAKPLHSVLVRAGNSVTVTVPSGAYELMFSTGSIWCSLEVGFKDGQITKLDKGFELKPQMPVALSLQSTGAKAADFQVFARRQPEPGAEPPAAQSVSAGVVELQQNADGHFYIEGSINGAPLRFLIDTGASITMLTKAAAAQVDLNDCRPGKSSTANGVVDVCVGMIPEMRIGPYRVNNSLAAANPNGEINLLGMNVLGQFQISTENGVMRLSKR